MLLPGSKHERRNSVLVRAVNCCTRVKKRFDYIRAPGSRRAWQGTAAEIIVRIDGIAIAQRRHDLEVPPFCSEPERLVSRTGIGQLLCARHGSRSIPRTDQRVQTENRPGIALLRGFFQPGAGPCRISRAVEPVEIEDGQEILRIRIARCSKALQLACRTREPLQPDRLLYT